MEELTKDETSKLRELFWAHKESQIALQKAMTEIAAKHGIDHNKERWTLSEDFKMFVKTQ